MSTASVGKYSEYAVRDDLISRGWVFGMQAAASKGAADLFMAHPVHGAALVQVGRGSKTLGPAARERLCALADMCGALALLAVHVPRRGITYWQVTRATPAHWERWTA